MDTRPLILIVTLSSVLSSGLPARADDWPTYRHDNARSGISRETLTAPLSEAWVFTAAHPPSHAWADPQPKPVESQLELPRVRFDDAFHVTAVGDLVVFGSSSENAVYALDAASGGVRWRSFTDGPVRLAPTLWKEKVYVGSDDGRVYCLDAVDGGELWRFQAAPRTEMLLGNGKMISPWPVRTGVVVDEDVAYFGAGIFPAEGVFLYAVDASSGKLLWKNDSYGHGGNGTVSPQGYMLASRDRLFVSSSRAMPAAFSREDGRLLFHRNFSWREVGMFGGTYSVLADGLLFNAIEQVVVVRQSDGRLAFTEGLGPSNPSAGARRLVVDDDLVVLLTGEAVLAADREGWTQQRIVGNLQTKLAKLRKALEGNPDLQDVVAATEAQLEEALEILKGLGEPLKWQVPSKENDSVVLTGEIVFLGGENSVRGLDLSTGAEVWAASTQGRARGLAVASGRLLVSTDQGSIHCFVPDAVTGGTGQWKQEHTRRTVREPFPDDARAHWYDKLAETLLRESRQKKGYALILGGNVGQLTLELLGRSELTAYVVEPDLKKAARAREALDAAGLHGPRAVVLQSSLDSVPYPDYFANLIICEGGFSTGVPGTPASEVLRMLKPCGGVAIAGRAPVDAEESEGASPKPLEEWLRGLGDPIEQGLEVSMRDGWARIARGPLPGAGSWTHQYAEPGNTAMGDDRLVKGPLGVLWFGEPGPGRMPSRHAYNVAPLAVEGRMFTQGENVLMAHDAYNGVLLWEREMPGALRLRMNTSCSNLAANEKGLFVAIGDQCHHLDPATGKTIRTYGVPSAPATPDGKEAPGRWMYVSCTPERLYGSRDNQAVFAVDIETGEVLWTREAGDLQLTSICMGDGRMFFVDHQVTEEQIQACLQSLPVESRRDRRGNPIPPDVRLVTALDAETGRTVWEKPQYVSDCVGVGRTGGDLTVMYSRGVLLLCGQPWNGHFWPEFFAGEFSRRSLIALSGEDGSLLWSGRRGYRSRPLIVEDRIVAEPWAYDLATGRELLRTHPVTGKEVPWQIARPGHHCGNIAAAPNVLFFRSGTTAYYDLEEDYGTAHFGAHRPGCWINCVPAGGVVVMPEASSGCVCPYSIHCTVVFKPREENRQWGMYSAPGSLSPIRHLAVNFGAPGDRKDTEGILWLAYPRPYSGATEEQRRLVLDLPLEVEFGKGGGYARENAAFLEVAGTDEDWIYASRCQGPLRCVLPLGRDGKTAGEPRKYTVRLHFREPDGRGPGERVFDVSLAGSKVLEGFDVARAAGDSDAALVKEIRGVEAAGELELSLSPRRGTPLLNGLEVLLEE